MGVSGTALEMYFGCDHCEIAFQQHLQDNLDGSNGTN